MELSGWHRGTHLQKLLHPAYSRYDSHTIQVFGIYWSLTIRQDSNACTPAYKWTTLICISWHIQAVYPGIETLENTSGFSPNIVPFLLVSWLFSCNCTNRTVTSRLQYTTSNTSTTQACPVRPAYLQISCKQTCITSLISPACPKQSQRYVQNNHSVRLRFSANYQQTHLYWLAMKFYQ